MTAFCGFEKYDALTAIEVKFRRIVIIFVLEGGSPVLRSQRSGSNGTLTVKR
jgi:hypothetical protein